MDLDSGVLRKREKVLIFVHGDFAQDLQNNLCRNYTCKLCHDLSIADIESKHLDILIITDKNKFSNLAVKYGFFLDRFFKIELKIYVHSIYEVLDKYFSLDSRQESLVESLLRYKSLDKVIESFPQESIVVRDEYEDIDISIKTITYIDGRQIFHGVTRDYRGETILFDKKNCIYYLLRGNLPVFEEYITLTNVDDYGQITVTPKFDGSLLNITFIHKDSRVFQYIRSKPLQKYIINSGIAFIGTKNRVITSDKVIVERLLKAIKMPIGNFVSNLVVQIKENTNVVFHFELMATDEYGSQCVTYSKCFCVLIGMTYFNCKDKTFILPRDIAVNTVEMKEFKTKSQVEEYICSQRNKMLKGDLTVEPEGFVIYSNNSVFKYKFPEYYVAHKPTCHFEEAIQLSDKLQGNTRYFKLQIPITSKILEVSNLLTPVYSLNVEERRRFIDRNRPLIKRADDEINKLKFKKKKKFKICDYLLQFSHIGPEHLKQYILVFLKTN